MIVNPFKIYLLVSECTMQVSHLKPKSRWLCSGRLYVPSLGNMVICNPLDQKQVGDLIGGSHS